MKDLWFSQLRNRSHNLEAPVWLFSTILLDSLIQAKNAAQRGENLPASASLDIIIHSASGIPPNWPLAWRSPFLGNEKLSDSIKAIMATLRFDSRMKWMLRSLDPHTFDHFFCIFSGNGCFCFSYYAHFRFWSKIAPCNPLNDLTATIRNLSNIKINREITSFHVLMCDKLRSCTSENALWHDIKPATTRRKFIWAKFYAHHRDQIDRYWISQK